MLSCERLPFIVDRKYNHARTLCASHVANELKGWMHICMCVCIWGIGCMGIFSLSPSSLPSLMRNARKPLVQILVCLSTAGTGMARRQNPARRNGRTRPGTTAGPGTARRQDLARHDGRIRQLSSLSSSASASQFQLASFSLTASAQQLQPDRVSG